MTDKDIALGDEEALVVSTLLKACVSAESQTVAEVISRLSSKVDVNILNQCLQAKDQNTQYSKLIRIAENYQSAEYKSPNADTDLDKCEGLVNLFPSVCLGDDVEKKTSHCIPTIPLQADTLQQIFSGTNTNVQNTQNNIQSFDDDLSRMLDQSEEHFSTAYVSSYLLVVMQKHFWSQPASKREGAVDVSLYEHSILTAAITVCLWRYITSDNKPFTTEACDKLLEEKSEKPFLMMIGDFSGIQRYLFDIQKQSSAAKRLKGRSFLVQFISEDIKRHILSEFGLTSVHVVVNAGGKFVILLPDTKETIDKYNSLKADIEQKMYEYFKGELLFNFALSKPFSGDEFGRRGDVVGFGRFYDDAFIELAKNKYRPFSTTLINRGGWASGASASADAFLLTDLPQETTLCPLCKKYLVGDEYKDMAKLVDESKICNLCGLEIWLGYHLRKRGESEQVGDNHWRNKDAYVLWSQRNDTGKGNLLYHRITLRDKPVTTEDDVLSVTALNPTDEATQLLAETGKIVDARFFSTYVPQKKERGVKDTYSVKEFEDIITDEWDRRDKHGLRKLAVLKGDVDDLGNIFYFGLKNFSDPTRDSYTAARLKTLSLYLNMFFEGYVDRLARKDERFRDLYIVFSGGDDFTIIGFWETLLDFALQLRNDLHHFTHNPTELHFSASIHLMGTKWPVYQEIQKAETELKAAKKVDHKKDKISLFGQILSWDDMKNIKKSADTLQKLARDSVSMGYLGKLHEISRMIRAEKTPAPQHCSDTVIKQRQSRIALWRPYLFYHTHRNFAGKEQEQARKWLENNLLQKSSDPAHPLINHLDVFADYLLYKNRK
jgi:CRISPR-associated protein Csm1